MRVAITMDADWAADDVLRFAVERVVAARLPLTIFATHPSPVWAELASDLVEIALHPNFNRLLDRQAGDGDYRSVFDEIHGHFPDAVGFRSHSLVGGSHILSHATTRGLRYESNQYYPHPLRPFADHDGLLRITQTWSDSHTLYSRTNFELPDFLGGTWPGTVAVFSFHPIHVFLNNSRQEQYARARGCTDMGRLAPMRADADAPGVDFFLGRLIAHIQARELPCIRLDSLVAR